MTARPLTAALALTLCAAAPAYAQDPSECSTVRMSDPGWTDITATNGVAAVLLDALGYQADIATLSVPVGYEALKNAQTDVFLGNWMPAQQRFRDDLDAAGTITELVQNLEGAKFTLAVNPAGAELGVADFADLDAHREAFEGRIYGIEPGAPANQSIQAMIEADEFGLGRLGAGRKRRAGDAGAGDAQPHDADSLSGLGAPSDERGDRDHLPVGWRRAVRPRLRRRHRPHACPQRMGRDLPQRRASASASWCSTSRWRTS